MARPCQRGLAVVWTTISSEILGEAGVFEHSALIHLNNGFFFTVLPFLFYDLYFRISFIRHMPSSNSTRKNKMQMRVAQDGVVESTT